MTDHRYTEDLGVGDPCGIRENPFGRGARPADYRRLLSEISRFDPTQIGERLNCCPGCGDKRLAPIVARGGLANMIDKGKAIVFRSLRHMLQRVSALLAFASMCMPALSADRQHTNSDVFAHDKIAASNVSTDAVCLNDIAGDTLTDFGFSIAADRHRLVVGEPSSNRVHLFEHNPRTGWRKAGTIVPSPDDLLRHGDRPGFGYAVDIDGATVLIGRFHEEATDQGGSRSFTYQSGVYVAEVPDAPFVSLSARHIYQGSLPNEFVFGFDVSLDRDIVVFGAKKETKPGYWQGIVAVGDRSGNKTIRKIQPPDDGIGQDFGASTDAANGYVLIGAPAMKPRGGGILMKVDGQSQSLPFHSDDVPPVGVVGTMVALGDNAAILSGQSVVTPFATIVSSLEENGRKRRLLPFGGYVSAAAGVVVVSDAGWSRIAEPSSEPDHVLFLRNRDDFTEVAKFHHRIDDESRNALRRSAVTPGFVALSHVVPRVRGEVFVLDFRSFIEQEPASVQLDCFSEARKK